MADVIDEIEHDGREWRLKVDSRGRRYAVADGYGRIPVRLYKIAKSHDPIDDYL